MTSSSRSSAAKGASRRSLRFAPFALLLGISLLAGCGKNDGAEEYREGIAAFEQGKFAEATESFRESLGYAPQNVDAMVMLARIALRKGEFRQAKQDLAPAETLAGNDPDVLELSGQIAYRLQDLAKARAAFTKLATTPSFARTARSRGYTDLGVLDYAGLKPKGDQEETLAKVRTEFLMAIALDNRNAAAHYNLGRLYAEFLHFPEFARDEFMLVTHLPPAEDVHCVRARDEFLPALKAQLAENLRTLGKGKTPGVAEADAAVRAANAAVAKGRYAEAKRQYQLASEIRPSDAKVLMALGGVAERIGSPAVAEKAYSRAIAAAPGAQKATALNRLVATLRKNGKPRVAEVYRGYAEFLAAVKR